MADDRRSAPRATVPLEGGWGGASGGQPCRIADLSIGGCFVESVNPPALGETVTVTISLPDGYVLEAEAEVTYSFAAMGFGARFLSLPSSDRQILSDNLDRLLAK